MIYNFNCLIETEWLFKVKALTYTVEAEVIDSIVTIRKEPVSLSISRAFSVPRPKPKPHVQYQDHSREAQSQ